MSRTPSTVDKLLLKDENVANSMEKAINDMIKESKKPKQGCIITNIKEVPNKRELWGKNTVFYVYNIEHETEQEVLGTQARSLFGSNLRAIKEFERGEKSQAQTDQYVIKFVSYKR